MNGFFRCLIASCGKTFASHDSLTHHHGFHHVDSRRSYENDIAADGGASNSDYKLASSTLRVLNGWEIEIEEDDGEQETESASESENDELGNLLDDSASHAMSSLYGTSMPKSSFFASMGSRGSLRSPLTS